jgi:hypothetical protein
MAHKPTRSKRSRTKKPLSRAIGLPLLDIACARDRLEDYVRTYPNYLDRDRDMLLLRIYEIVTGVRG